jgi:hypothetical protein
MKLHDRLRFRYHILMGHHLLRLLRNVEAQARTKHPEVAPWENPYFRGQLKDLLRRAERHRDLAQAAIDRSHNGVGS